MVAMGICALDHHSNAWDAQGLTAKIAVDQVVVFCGQLTAEKPEDLQNAEPPAKQRSLLEQLKQACRGKLPQ